MSLVPPISPATPGPKDVVYPSSDGRPVAETERQRALESRIEIDRLRNELESLRRRQQGE